jgi:hypothetical protein
MKVKLQARLMWDAIEYGDINDHEDWRALESKYCGGRTTG